MDKQLENGYKDTALEIAGKCINIKSRYCMLLKSIVLYHRKKSIGQIRIKLCLICNSSQLGFSEVQNFSNLGKMVVLLLKIA